MKIQLYKHKLLWKDLLHNKLVFGTSLIMIIIISLLFLVSNILVDSACQSVKNVSNRLGADIVIVSNEFDSNLKDTLFMGSPSTFEFNYSVVQEQIGNVEGISEYSRQLFMSSLSDSCCEQKVQFVVFDEKSDFIISSWLNDNSVSLGKRDIIIGYNINYNVGDMGKFFGCLFNVVGKLDETKMGYDNCIFVNDEGGKSISRFLHLDDSCENASLICVNVDKNEKIDDVLYRLNIELGKAGLVAYRSNELYEDIDDNINAVSEVIHVFLLIISIIAFVSLFGLISLGVANKKDNFALLGMFGVRKRTQYMMILWEYMLETLLGSNLGIIGGIILLVLFKDNVSNYINMPVIIDITSIKHIVCTLAVCILIVLSSCYVAVNNQWKDVEREI